ncbi:hypothetical protein [Corynebacterium glucuronolyticum]|uniref:hypothetical protein n=1 Tax=Corynebacterium glucuronolyticum TaxID=39791 RepID=UPI00019C1CB6|nr:hypothetical protein [Corynebacterium glucuronolyticum]EEI27721.1 Tat pathway signal sequence domain protein [Corynebacterium glucuronolyticum ATCC 51867]
METKGGSSAPKPRRRVISVISSISLALGTLTAVPPAFAAEPVGKDITAKQGDTFIEKINRRSLTSAVMAGAGLNSSAR